MRSLVTGGDGFVGRWLIRHLVESGDDVGGPLVSRATSTRDSGGSMSRTGGLSNA